MRIKPVLISTGLTLFVVFGCSDDRLGGNTTQTENTLARILVDSVLPAWNRPTKVTTVATLKLDSSNFDFTQPDSVGSDITVEKDSGQPIPFSVLYWDKPGRQGRLQVRLDTSLLHPGTRFNVRWIQAVKPRSNPAAVWQSIPDSQKLAIGSVLVDDFEGANFTSKLPDSTSWYKASNNDSVGLFGPTLLAAGRGRTGKVIHLGYDNSPSYTGRYALLGISLVSGGGTHSLRSLDSIVLFVRASGMVTVAIDRLAPHTKAKAWLHRSAMDSTTWVRWRIRPQDFDAPDGIGNNVGWNATRDSVTTLSFLLADGKDLYVDDIRFYGVDRDDLK